MFNRTGAVECSINPYKSVILIGLAKLLFITDFAASLGKTKIRQNV